MESIDIKHNFLTVENLKLCIQVLKQYMDDKFAFNIETDGRKTSVKKLVYDVMKDVDDRYGKSPQMQLKDLNNITLNVARDVYKKQYNLYEQLGLRPQRQGPKAPPSEFVQSESVRVQQPRNNIAKEFERMASSRQKEQEVVVPVLDMKPVMEQAEKPDDFFKQLDLLAKNRDLSDVQGARLDAEVEINSLFEGNKTHPKDIYAPLANVQAPLSSLGMENIERDNSLPITRKDFLIPSSSQHILIDKYLSINGFDRNWTMDKKRFGFKVDFNYGENSIQNRYKNIKSICVTNVIIPMEIIDKPSIVNAPKMFYNHEFKFSFPYLMLRIDEFTDMYDGTNDNVRRAFSTLIFDKCYYAPNGRGYLILKSAQKEKKVFHPTPLSSLNSLSLSVRRPNGQLLNDSVDNYGVFKIEYDLLNRRYLKIVTDVYFDRNEFYKGDTIMFSKFQMTNIDVSMSQEHINKFNDFINRPEGHEIVEIGQANDQGFLRNFFIHAPGSFDSKNGMFVLDENLIANLNAYNDAIDWITSPPRDPNGYVLNASLQCCLAFKLQVIVSDPSMVDVSLN